jgi:hypothetical protein
MRRFRQIAYVILFAGWMLPAVLAQNARARAAKTAPVRSRLELMIGVEPPPTPADRAASVFRGIAGVWFVFALVYAGVLTVRLRRTLLG